MTRSRSRSRTQPEIGGRVDAAIDVAAPVDLDRPVEAGDRARGRDGVGELGARRVGRPEGDPVAGRVVAGDDPQPAVRRPARRDDPAHLLAQRLGREDPTGQPAGDHARRGVAARMKQGAQRQRPRARPDRRRPAEVELERGAAAAIGLRRGHPGGVDDALEGLARRVGDHEPGRHPAGEQRGQHRAGRGADDHLGTRRVPAGLLRDRIERADQPGPTLDPAGAKDEPDLHRRDANRCGGGCESGSRPTRTVPGSGASTVARLGFASLRLA